MSMLIDRPEQRAGRSLIERGPALPAPFNHLEHLKNAAAFFK
jgi:hypothetical protein